MPSMCSALPRAMTSPLSARLYYLRAKLGAMEMLKRWAVNSGHDDAFISPMPLTESVDSNMAAYRSPAYFLPMVRRRFPAIAAVCMKGLARSHSPGR